MTAFTRAPFTWTVCLLILFGSVLRGITSSDTNTALEATRTLFIPGKSKSIESGRGAPTLTGPSSYLTAFSPGWDWGSSTKAIAAGEGQAAVGTTVRASGAKPREDIGGLLDGANVPSRSSSPSPSSHTLSSYFSEARNKFYSVMTFPHKYVATVFCAVRPAELLLAVVLIVGSGSVLEVLFGNQNDVFIPVSFVPGWNSATQTTHDRTRLDRLNRRMVVPFLGSATYRWFVGWVMIGGIVVYGAAALVAQLFLLPAASTTANLLFVTLDRLVLAPGTTAGEWKWVVAPSPMFLALTIHFTRRLVTIPVTVARSTNQSGGLVRGGSNALHREHSRRNGNIRTYIATILPWSSRAQSSAGLDDTGREMGEIRMCKSLEGEGSSLANSGMSTPEIGPSSTTARRSTSMSATPNFTSRLAHWLRTALPPPPPPPLSQTPQSAPFQQGDRSDLLNQVSSPSRGGICESICGGSSTMMSALLNPSERTVVSAGGSSRITMLGGVLPLCMDGAGGGTSSIHPLRTMFKASMPAEASHGMHSINQDSFSSQPTTTATFADQPRPNVEDEGDTDADDGLRDPAFVAAGGSPKLSPFDVSNSLVMDIVAIQMLLSYVYATITVGVANTYSLWAVFLLRLILVSVGPVLVSYGLVVCICYFGLLGLVSRPKKYFKAAQKGTSPSNGNSTAEEPPQRDVLPGPGPNELFHSSSEDDNKELGIDGGGDDDQNIIRLRLLPHHDKDSLFHRIVLRLRRRLQRAQRQRTSRFSPRSGQHPPKLLVQISCWKTQVIAKAKQGLFDALCWATVSEAHRSTTADPAHLHITEATMRPSLRRWVSEEWRGYLVQGAALLRKSSVAGSMSQEDHHADVSRSREDLCDTIRESSSSASASSRSVVLAAATLAYVDLVHKWDVGSGPIGALSSTTFTKPSQ